MNFSVTHYSDIWRSVIPLITIWGFVYRKCPVLAFGSVRLFHPVLWIVLKWKPFLCLSHFLCVWVVKVRWSGPVFSKLGFFRRAALSNNVAKNDRAAILFGPLAFPPQTLISYHPTLKLWNNFQRGHGQKMEWRRNGIMTSPMTDTFTDRNRCLYSKELRVCKCSCVEWNKYILRFVVLLSEI